MRLWRKRPAWLLAIDLGLSMTALVVLVVVIAHISQENSFVIPMICGLFSVIAFASGHWILTGFGILSTWIFAVITYAIFDGGSPTVLNLEFPVELINFILVFAAMIRMLADYLKKPKSVKPSMPPGESNYPRELDELD
ncbi:MAG: hypothetical protein KDC26_07055 [Armatimonadetes bacterium]|nr:hypothetical protein [Armatimonadota bacterium]